ncbi:hypothetical protein RRSWK_01513 [Rhodopirellula sp. SWK7]|nr:hypothetical protein RRSWK_01513 [Rhodopirellula sp. SWK7]
MDLVKDPRSGGKREFVRGRLRRFSFYAFGKLTKALDRSLRSPERGPPSGVGGYKNGDALATLADTC